MAKTKALISCAVTAQLICVFVFAYANCWFSHAQAHLFSFNLHGVVVMTSSSNHIYQKCHSEDTLVHSRSRYMRAEPASTSHGNTFICPIDTGADSLNI